MKPPGRPAGAAQRTSITQPDPPAAALTCRAARRHPRYRCRCPQRPQGQQRPEGQRRPPHGAAVPPGGGAETARLQMAAAATAGPPLKMAAVVGRHGSCSFCRASARPRSVAALLPQHSRHAEPLRAACGRDPVGRVLRASPCRVLPGAGCLQWPWGIVEPWGGCVEVPGPNLPPLPCREWWLLPLKLVVQLLVGTGGCPAVCATLCGLSWVTSWQL